MHNIENTKTEESKTKALGSRQIMAIVTGVLLLLGCFAYVAGATFFAYYGDLDAGILILAGAGILLSIVTAVFYDKKGDLVILRITSLAGTVLPTVCLMRLASARVYSIAVLLLSDLERDNVEGYYALYFSIGAMGLFFIGAFCNAVGNFMKSKQA